MSKEYYIIIRKYYGFPNYYDTDLSKKEDCFSFDTEHEAKQCLQDIYLIMVNGWKIKSMEK